MDEDIAIIESIFDRVLPTVPASRHRWGRKVWLRDIEIGEKGKLIFIDHGEYKVTSLSTITNIIKTSNCLEVFTKSSIYKLQLLPKEVT